MKIFFTSDMHFLHKNILTYRSQFSSLEEMHELIISRWNSTVSKEDVVYILGDVMLGACSQIEAIFTRLNGKKYLIRGNHDTNKIVNKLTPYLEGVYSMYSLKHNKQMFTLCHFPMREWNLKEYGGIHLYGHVHNNDHRGGCLKHPNAFHVGMDTNHFTPVSLEQVLSKVEEQNVQYNKPINKLKRRVFNFMSRLLKEN